MARFTRMVLLGVAFLAMAQPLLADDVTGADILLCSSSEIRLCTFDEACVLTRPWEMNIPAFIEIDLTKKTLSTTKASRQDRSTPIKNLERADGLIILQGAEAGRAFSFLIAEETGEMTAAVANELGGIVGFGSCTPLPVR